MRIKFEGWVHIPDDDVDGASDVDHALIHIIAEAIEKACDVDGIYDKLNMEWESYND